jgi:hypothetical protein
MVGATPLEDSREENEVAPRASKKLAYTFCKSGCMLPVLPYPADIVESVVPPKGVLNHESAKIHSQTTLLCPAHGNKNAMSNSNSSCRECRNLCEKHMVNSAITATEATLDPDSSKMAAISTTESSEKHGVAIDTLKSHGALRLTPLLNCHHSRAQCVPQALFLDWISCSAR